MVEWLTISKGELEEFESKAAAKEREEILKMIESMLKVFPAIDKGNEDITGILAARHAIKVIIGKIKQRNEGRGK